MLKRLSACVFAMLAFLLAASTAYSQDTSDRRTYFTFDQPVTLPGVTLPAGTYLFRLANPDGDRTLVQILSADRSRVYATLMTRPIDRDAPAEQPDVRFLEAAAPLATVLKAWWYPGLRTGWEFIYPAEQAARIAALPRTLPAPAPAVAEADRR